MSRRVIIESPFAADTQEGVERNLQYLRVCMNDCIAQGEAPFASHGLYTQPGVLNDRDREQRKLGIEAGLAWKDVAHATIVYTDLGISDGMRYGIEAAERIGQRVVYRSFGPGWEAFDGDRSTARWGK